MGDHSAGGHVLVYLTLALLALLGPERRLVGRHRQRWPEVDDAVGALGDLPLRPGLVEVRALAQVGRRLDHTTALHADVTVETMGLGSHASLMSQGPFNRKTAIPYNAYTRSSVRGSFAGASPVPDEDDEPQP